VKLAWLIGTIIALPSRPSVTRGVDRCLGGERQMTRRQLAFRQHRESAGARGVRSGLHRNGIPLRGRRTGDRVEISAAGPDRLFGTADDVNTWEPWPSGDPGRAVCALAFIGPIGVAAPRELLR
jgi:hypothetical protein